MTQFNWEFLGAALLERERRPVIVLGLDGRIVQANRALRFFVEEGTRVSLVHFGEEWVLPENHAAFSAEWERARAGRRACVSVVLRPTVFQLESVFELVPMVADGEVRSVMLVMVDAQPVGAAREPFVPPQGLLYEVSLDASGRSEQRLLRVFSAERRKRPDPASPCYRSLHGRDRPCETCPVRELGGLEANTVVHLESTKPFSASLMSARRVQDDLASVSIFPLDQQTYGALVRARVEAVGAEGKLTRREQHVLDFILMGRTLGDVAAAHGITARTAKYHQQNLLRKLGAESRMDLFRLLS